VPRREPGAIRVPSGFARRALAEDRAGRDRTTRAVIPASMRAQGSVVAQATGVLSGVRVAARIASTGGLAIDVRRADGSPVRPGTVVLRLRGPARALLSSERTILNVLMHASGVATLTARAVRAARPMEVWGTRKTLPGLRDLQKAALAHGGGRPHRRDLSDRLLVKNNHLALVPLAEAVRRARAVARAGETVEVEVRTPNEAVAVARAGARAILIDNATPYRARAIVAALERAGLRRGRWIELSGGITPANVGRYRAVGADAASLGALTHSAPALPFHLVVRPARLSRPRT
jgi:nicotinate-nucleotide pyrophosphorylase (carboxylating)